MKNALFILAGAVVVYLLLKQTDKSNPDSLLSLIESGRQANADKLAADKAAADKAAADKIAADKAAADKAASDKAAADQRSTNP